MEETESSAHLFANPFGNQSNLPSHRTKQDRPINISGEDRADYNNFVFGSPSYDESSDNIDNDNNDSADHDNYVPGIYVSGCISL